MEREEKMGVVVVVVGLMRLEEKSGEGLEEREEKEEEEGRREKEVSTTMDILHEHKCLSEEAEDRQREFSGVLCSVCLIEIKILVIKQTHKGQTTSSN